MITLNTLSSNIKKYVKPLALAAFICLIVFLIFFRFYGNKFFGDPNLPTLPPPHFDSFPPLVVSLNTKGLKGPKNQPKRLLVFKPSENTELSSKSDNLAKSLGFAQKPIAVSDINLGAGLLYSNAGGNLIIYKKIISFKKNLTTATPLAGNENELNSKGLGFMENLGLDISSLDNPTITYSKITYEELTESDKNSANLINFNFSSTLNGLSVFTPGNITNITLDGAGSTMKFNYHLMDPSPLGTEYPIINFNDSLKALWADPAKYLVLIDPSEASQNTSPLVFTIQNTSLVYYYSTYPEDIIQPVWLFKGSSQAGGLGTKATFAVPAIKSRYFQSPTDPKP